MISLCPNSFQVLYPNSTCFSVKNTGLHFSKNNVLSLLPKKKNKVILCHRNGYVRGSNDYHPLSFVTSSMKVTGDNMVSSPREETKKNIDLRTCKDTKSFGTFLDVQEGIGIVKFLKEKTFFITGATGFLAKALIEKILRSIPDVRKIYVLIKAKDKDVAIDRLKSEVINSELFSCLRNIHGQNYEDFMFRKLIPVVGNVAEANFGIEAELADEISEEVDVIINSAANTTLDERYDISLDTNTIGPGRLMAFAKRFKRLKLFLQVSTAYANGKRQGRVLEKPFCIGDNIAREMASSEYLAKSMPLLDIESEIKLAFDSGRTSTSDASFIQEMKELGLERANLYGWQHTYACTKAMGEMVINSMRGDIPVAIIRPSIIESSCREPFSGWIQGIRMLEPMILSYGKGQLPGFLADPNGVIDVVPVDMVVNAILAAIAKHGSNGDAGMHTYHIASSVTNPLIIKDLIRLLYEHFSTFPWLDSKGKAIMVPQMKLFKKRDDFSLYSWKEIVERKLPKRLCMKAVEQAINLASLYEPYFFYDGRFDNTNTHKLLEDLSEEEKMTFGFDERNIDWEDYILNIHIPGVRRYVMKGRGSDSGVSKLRHNGVQKGDQLAFHDRVTI